MPTFFEVYQSYLKDPRSIELSKKKYKQLHQFIGRYYNNWNHREPVVYQKFTNEAGEPCEVRVYPDNFIPKMKFLIIDFCEKYKKNLAEKEAQEKKKAEPSAKPVPEPKKRTRKPIQQPVYSTKKSP